MRSKRKDGHIIRGKTTIDEASLPFVSKRVYFLLLFPSYSSLYRVIPFQRVTTASRLGQKKKNSSAFHAIGAARASGGRKRQATALRMHRLKTYYVCLGYATITTLCTLDATASPEPQDATTIICTIASSPKDCTALQSARFSFLF